MLVVNVHGSGRRGFPFAIIDHKNIINSDASLFTAKKDKELSR